MQTADRHVLARTCYRDDGKPKLCFDTFDEAWEHIQESTGRYSARTTAYRCPGGLGWHVAKAARTLSNGSVNPAREVD